jgi:glyoxylate reductase
MKPKVYVTRLLPKEAMERIQSYCDATVWDGELPPPRHVLLEQVRDVEGLLCLLTDKVDAELMSKAAKLRAVSNYAVGYDNVDVAEATRRGIIVTNTPDVLTETTADFAFALMMAGGRRVVEGDRQVRAGNWKTWGALTLLGQDIHGATLGIIGLGRIGRAVARRAQGFDMKLLYHDIRRVEEVEGQLGLEYVELGRLLTESDFVTIHTSLTSATRHLIGAEELAMMKRTAVLVNSARGAIVDNLALFEALRDGKIAFAALDVTDPEPIPSSHPLLTLSNIIITPHIASATVATRTKMGLMAAENLIVGLKGQMPPNPVNPEVFAEKAGAAP